VYLGLIAGDQHESASGRLRHFEKQNFTILTAIMGKFMRTTVDLLVNRATVLLGWRHGARPPDCERECAFWQPTLGRKSRIPPKQLQAVCDEAKKKPIKPLIC